MYQYSNDAYNKYPSSAENLPHKRFRYDTSPAQNRTVGIGYYGASRNQQLEDKLPVATSNMLGTNGRSVPEGLSTPSSRRPLDTSMENTSDSWNYIQADVDLSPPTSRVMLNSLNKKSPPSRPLSEGSVLEAYNRSRIVNYRQKESNSVPLLGYGEYSPQSTDQSFTLYPSTRNQSTIGTGTADAGKPGKPPALSLRERWQQSRLHSDDDISSPQPSYLSRSELSPTSVNQSTNSFKDVSRQSDGDQLSRSVFSHGELDKSPCSTMERQYNTYSTTSSIRRDPLSHKKLPNGVVKPVQGSSLNNSQRSLNISRMSFRSQSGKVTLYSKGYGVHNSLVNMALAAVLSLIMCFLCTQLLFRVTARQTPTLYSLDSVLRSNVSHHNAAEVVVALTSIAIMLDLCCLLTCVIQGYFAAKLMKCKQGEERAFCYLKECMPTRFIAIIGFFFSIPAFFFGLMLYIIMEYRSTPAIIAVVVLTIGVSFCISMATHSTFIWFNEKSKANNDIPITPRETNNNKTKVINGELTNQNELSTLV